MKTERQNSILTIIETKFELKIVILNFSSMELRKEIGVNLRVLRESMSYTQAFVASNLGVATNTYSLMERGQAQLTLDRVEKLARLYRVDPSELIALKLPKLNQNKASSNDLDIEPQTDGRSLTIHPYKAIEELIALNLERIQEQMQSLKKLILTLRDIQIK